MKDLYQLKLQDIDRCSEMYANTFSDYPMFTHIIRDDPGKEKTKIFLRFLIKYSVLYGEAYATSDKLDGVILYSDNRKYYFGPIRALRSGAFTLSRIGKEAGKRFNVFNEFATKVHKRIISEPHLYVIMIGVDPDKQGLGIGSKLMSKMLKEADEKSLPCYLETHVMDNVAFYEKLGFEVASEDCVPNTDVIQYSMLRKNV